MALVLDGATVFRLALNPAKPATHSIWFYPTDTTTTIQTLLINQSVTGAGTQWFWVKLNGTTGEIEIDYTDAVSLPFNRCLPGNATMNAWNHLAWRFDGTAGPWASLNGASPDTGSNSIFPTVTAIRIGAKQTGAGPATFGNYFTGRVAELAIWTADLYTYNNDFYKPLADGFCPLFAPQDVAGGLTLLKYWPFLTNSRDRMNEATTFVETGSPSYGDHCPQIYPSSGMGGARAG